MDPEPTVVRVLPDVVAIEKEFDYSVPADWAVPAIGSVVRVALHGRRVRAWVTAVGVEPDVGIELRPLAKVVGLGPGEELVDLARWAAWRWAGRPAHLLRTATPPASVRALPALPTPAPVPAPGTPDAGGPDPVIERALAVDCSVLRLGPLADRFPLVRAAVARAAGDRGQALLLCPTTAEAVALGARLRRADVPTAVLVDDGRAPSAAAGEWGRAAAGATAVVGTRAAAWAPAPALCRAVVLDEHDDGYQQEQTPTWHARDVVVERCARAGAGCVLVSPCPSMEALDRAELVAPDRLDERAQWPTLEVVDRRDEEPGRSGLYSPRLVELLRGEGRVVCVLNRTGRSRLLACVACGELARCERCEAAVAQTDAGLLRCRRCGTERPVVCLHCGGTRLKNLRVGVSRAREELEALVGEPVEEVTASASGPAERSPSGGDGPGARIVVGTEAVLHRVDRADAVAFLDVDQELGAYRYRTVEQAMALLSRAARLLRVSRGRLVVQTRQPENLVLRAVGTGDPALVPAAERPLRRAMRFPPTHALAVVSGAGAPAFVDALGRPPGVEVLGPTDDRWLLRAPDHATLCDALARTPRPPDRLRVEVDPLGI